MLTMSDNEKRILRNVQSGLSELLPAKYLDIFPDQYEEVRTTKPVARELHTPRQSETTKKRITEPAADFDADKNEEKA